MKSMYLLKGSNANGSPYYSTHAPIRLTQISSIENTMLAKWGGVRWNRQPEKVLVSV